METITCQICGKAFTSLYAHLRTHKLSAKDYEAKYGGPLAVTAVKAKLQMSEEHRKAQSARVAATNRRRWKEQREACLSQLDAARASPDRVNREALSVKAKEQWKDETFRKTTSEAVSESNRNRWAENREKELENAQRAFRGIGPEIKSANSKLQWDPTHPSHSKAVAHLTTLHQSPKRKAALSKRSRELWESGHFANRDKYKGQRYKDIWFRSSWEVIFAQWLDSKGLEWVYEPKLFRLSTEHGEITYIPDFWVPAWDTYVEVKADWAWDSDANHARTKVEALERAGEAIVTVRDAEIQAMAEEISV